MAPDASAGDNARKVFDFERLASISDGDEEFERELAGEYLAQSRQLLQQLAEAIERGDVEALRRGAHTLKGSSRTVGADALADVGAELERGAGPTDPQALVVVLARAQACLDSTERALDGHFGSDTYRKAA